MFEEHTAVQTLASRVTTYQVHFKSPGLCIRDVVLCTPLSVSSLGDRGVLTQR